MKLTNKTAIVTGAASGFGFGIARAFAREGANVIVADIDKNKCTQAIDALELPDERAIA